MVFATPFSLSKEDCKSSECHEDERHVSSDDESRDHYRDRFDFPIRFGKGYDGNNRQDENKYYVSEEVSDFSLAVGLRFEDRLGCKEEPDEDSCGSNDPENACENGSASYDQCFHCFSCERSALSRFGEAVRGLTGVASEALFGTPSGFMVTPCLVCFLELALAPSALVRLDDLAFPQEIPHGADNVPNEDNEKPNQLVRMVLEILLVTEQHIDQLGQPEDKRYQRQYVQYESHVFISCRTLTSPFSKGRPRPLEIRVQVDVGIPHVVQIACQMNDTMQATTVVPQAIAAAVPLHFLSRQNRNSAGNQSA